MQEFQKDRHIDLFWDNNQANYERVHSTRPDACTQQALLQQCNVIPQFKGVALDKGTIAKQEQRVKFEELESYGQKKFQEISIVKVLIFVFLVMKYEFLVSNDSFSINMAIIRSEMSSVYV